MNNNREKRQQIEEREAFSEDIRLRIQHKCKDKCVWCGKKVFLGYEGTIDHFIPLKKGGTNDEVNLVLMCHDCNQKKGSRIFPLNVAATYLEGEPHAELAKYFEDYVRRYDYVSRGNLMSSDVYEMFFLPSALEQAQMRAQKKGKKLDVGLKRSKYLLKRAYPDDQERIIEYFIRYLAKYKMLDSPEAAGENIKFWMRFGSIYYVEKNNEIAAICCVTVNVNGYISFDVFAYYSTLLAWTMAKGFVTCLGGAVMAENDLPYLPLSFNMLVKDELIKYRIPHEQKALSDGTMMLKLAFMFNSDYKDPDVSEEATAEYAAGVVRFAEFIHRFDDNIEDDLMLYLYQNDLMDYQWMADEITERNFFDRDLYREIDY